MDEDHSEMPRTLGRYRIVRRLGAGGMAEVFLAKSTGAEGIEKLLVLKRILPTFASSAKFVAMFVDEAKVAMRLNHPNIVQIYAFEQVRDEFLLAMELVDGFDLNEFLDIVRRKKMRLPHGIAAFVVMEAAKGIDYAHKRRDEHGEPLDIVHCDVSPQNVLISYEGAVKIADFGIARARLVSEEAGVIKGKFSYMSPEQARGERLDHRSDVYSLGLLLAELLTGTPPFGTKQNGDVLELVRKGEFALPRSIDATVPVELDAIVQEATQPEREKRTQSARAMATALGRFLHAQPDVYDATALEQFIEQWAPRAHPPGTEASAEASDLERQALQSRVSLHGVGAALTNVTSTSNADIDGQVRERRHVVVVSGNVHFKSRSARFSDGAKKRAGSRRLLSSGAVRILDDIAYKADAVLSWSEQHKTQFRFILGLGRGSVHDPLRATRLALDVIEALAGVSEDTDTTASASMGISRGVVSTIRDRGGRLLRYEPIGGVIELADGLAAAGRSGQILATGEVYRWARREFAFEERARHELDSDASDVMLPQGLRTYRLRGPRTQRERALEASALRGPSAIVGRNAELRLLTEAYLDVVNHRRSVFIGVVGDLGVGKSALVTAAVGALDPAPRVLRSECTFGTSDLPFAATAELVRQACDIPHDASPEHASLKLRETVEHLMTSPEERASILPWLEPLVSPTPGSQSAAQSADRTHVVARALRLFLGALAARSPLVIVVDALHWADAPSLEAMSAILERTYDLPLLGILVTRPDPRTESSLSGVVRVDVTELDDAARRELIRTRFDGAIVPPDVEQAIVDRAGGNPFFISELVEALLERGIVAIEQNDGGSPVVRRRRGGIALPTTLEDAVAARLRELPEPERLALRWLAVAGPGFRDGDLEAVSGTRLSSSLNELERRGFLVRRPDGTHFFRSAVVRHEAYEMIDNGDLLRMHKRVGAFLSALPSPVAPARIARHLERAGDDKAAAKAYLEAAAAARAVYSNRDALRFYDRALALLPPESGSRFQAHEAREQIFRVMGRRTEQEAELRAMRAHADQRDDPEERSIAYSRFARYLLDGRQPEQVEALLEEALGAARASHRPQLEIEALYLSARLARAQGDLHKGLAACDEALTRAGFQPDYLVLRGLVLIQRGILLRRLGQLDEALRTNTEAIVIFHRLGARGYEAQALNSLGRTLASLGAYEDAITAMRTSIVVDREIGDLVHLGLKLSNVGQLYAELGDVQRADDFLRRSLDLLHAFDDYAGRCQALCAMAELMLEHLNDAKQATELLDDARLIAQRTSDPYDLARERLVRSQLRAYVGDFTAAEGYASDAISHARIAKAVGYELLAAAHRGLALAHLGRTDEAVAIARDVQHSVQTRGAVEREERIYVAIAQTFRLLGDHREAALAYRAAKVVVDTRLQQIRSEFLRQRYEATAPVQAIRGAAA